MRIPSSTGIAGWVLVTGQPIVIDDLQQDPRFARQAAERTGYVPQGLMAVPLANGDTMLGVLQVLDRSKDRAFSLGEIDLLIMFANQAAIGLDLLQTARRARAVAEQGEGGAAVVARIAALLEHTEDECRGPAAARGARAGAEAAPDAIDRRAGPGRRRGARRRLSRAKRGAKDLGLDVREVSLDAELLRAREPVALEVRAVVLVRCLDVGDVTGLLNFSGPLSR